MKKIVTSLKIVIPAVALIFFVSSCKKNSTSLPGVKSATVVFKAAAKSTAYKSTKTTVTIPVKGGNMDLSSAWINFGKVNIQENTGHDGQSTSEGTDSESTTETKDSTEIYLPGPYAFNILSDTITLSNVQVYPGTFKKVDLTFIPKTDSVFNGNSIVIKGQFTPTGGVAIPIVLKSKYAHQVELKLAKGITVTANSKVSLAIVFNLNKWLTSIDLTSATQTSGSILIDGTHNYKLLQAFEGALSNQGMDLNEEHGSHTESGTGTDSSSDSSDHNSDGGND